VHLVHGGVSAANNRALRCQTGRPPRRTYPAGPRGQPRLARGPAPEGPAPLWPL